MALKICEICGEDIDEQGIMIQLPKGREQMLCALCLLNRDLSDEIELLFFWGHSPNFIKNIINDRQAMEKASTKRDVLFSPYSRKQDLNCV